MNDPKETQELGMKRWEDCTLPEKVERLRLLVIENHATGLRERAGYDKPMRHTDEQAEIGSGASIRRSKLETNSLNLMF